MPELPDVENVRLGLRKHLPSGSRSERVTLYRADLRFPFPVNLDKKLKGESVLGVHRRAKYLIFETEKYWLVSHLGMTGSWRAFDGKETHDHVQWKFVNGPTLVFNDPRRFGFLTLFSKKTTPSHFENLGPEPLEKDFHPVYLFHVSRKKNQPLKSFLLDQKIVAGLGNIYVCEALFSAGLSPIKKAMQLTRKNCDLLVPVIQSILRNAIAEGGSTIRDYKNAEGKSGDFQDHFNVYGRDGERCLECRTVIRKRKQAGRSTFWCHQCQK